MHLLFRYVLSRDGICITRIQSATLVFEHILHNVQHELTLLKNDPSGENCRVLFARENVFEKLRCFLWMVDAP